jgi:hypothetical protein
MPYKSSINTGLPNIPDPPDPDFFAEFTRVYNAIRNLTLAIDSYTGALPADTANFSQTPPSSSILSQNVLRVYVPFGVTIAYGQMVNLYNVSGVLTARLAAANVGGLQAHGWCSIPASSGAYGEIMLGGLSKGVTGLTPGTTYYLSNTPGAVSTTPGTVSQRLGFALGTDYMFMQPQLI